MSLNRWEGIGRLVADPRSGQNGETKWANFRMAVDSDFVREGGERDTLFINVGTFGKLAETVANNLNKGRLVFVEGRLGIDEYTDGEGVQRTQPQVIARAVQFLDWPNKEGQNSQGAQQVNAPPQEVPF